MEVTKIIRNKWFLMVFSFFYIGIVWASFKLFYRNELLLQKIYKSKQTPDTLQVMTLYNKMVRMTPDPRKFDSFYHLAKILERIERKKEVIKVLNKLIKTAPEDRELRLWLALELHNKGRYREAEKHFVALLKNHKSRIRPTHQSIAQQGCNQVPPIKGDEGVCKKTSEKRKILHGNTIRNGTDNARISQRKTKAGA